MNMHDKIQKIFSQTRSDAPEWAIELLEELKSIKHLLEATKQEQRSYSDRSSFYDFINNFREEMKADVANNIYPEIEYQSKKIGVNFRGLLYYKGDASLLKRQDAFKVYRYLYENKQRAV